MQIWPSLIVETVNAKGSGMNFGFDINITPKNPIIAEITSCLVNRSFKINAANKTVAIGLSKIKGTDSDNGNIVTPMKKHTFPKLQKKNKYRSALLISHS